MSKAPEMYVPEAFTLILIRSIPRGGNSYCRLEYAIAMLTISLMLNS